MSSDVDHVELAGQAVPVVRLDHRSTDGVIAANLADAGVPMAVPVAVLVGGAGGLEPADARVCALLFEQALLPVVEELGAVLVDGGTDAGVMAIAAQARRHIGGQSPHVGVVAEGTVRWPGKSGAAVDAANLEPHHTHVVVVPGDEWGDEAPWLHRVADAVAGTAPSVTVLANGGNVAYDDVRLSLFAKRSVLVLAGTGRAAAAIAAARSGGPTDERAAELAASARVTVTPGDPDGARAALARALGRSLWP